MDINADLLPRVDLLKIAKTSKDGKHHQKNKANKTYGRVNDNKSEVIQLCSKTSKWQEVDRRSGKDRRKLLEQRGRWLESRDRSNRRTIELAICLEV